MCIIPARTQRGGKKHEGHVKAVIREEIAKWPIIPQPLPKEPSKKKKNKKNFHSTSLTKAKEQMVEQAIRDGTLSKACKLLASGDSSIEVDVESEMKKLHPNGREAFVDYVSGQLNYSVGEIVSPPGLSFIFCPLYCCCENYFLSFLVQNNYCRTFCWRDFYNNNKSCYSCIC